MTRLLVSSPDAVTLVGGGPVPAHLLTLALDRAPHVVAADGGADRAQAHGITPRTIIGDMDSLSKVENWQNSDVKMFKIDDQDTTDLEKCLEVISTPLILGVGFLGARMDHVLAAMNALVKLTRVPTVLIGECDVLFAAGREVALDLDKGTTVSLFPFADVRGTRSEGLQWSVEGLAMAPDGRVGTSNIASGGPVRLGFDQAGVLVSLPLAALDAAIAALSTRGR